MVAKTLVAIADGLWGIDDVARLPGGAKLPLRSTLIALKDGGLAMHSPVAMSDEVVAAIDRVGVVRHIVSPSALHHLHLVAAAQRFPSAKIYGTRALLSKRKTLKFDGLLNDGIPQELSSVLESMTLAGASKVDETVFLHKPSGSLLVTDLVFNITRPQGMMSKFMFSCTGTNGVLAQSRLWQFYAKDKQAFVASTHQMLDWHFDKLIPCHGEVLLTGAKDAVHAGLRWK